MVNSGTYCSETCPCVSFCFKGESYSNEFKGIGEEYRCYSFELALYDMILPAREPAAIRRYQISWCLEGMR